MKAAAEPFLEGAYRLRLQATGSWRRPVGLYAARTAAEATGQPLPVLALAQIEKIGAAKIMLTSGKKPRGAEVTTITVHRASKRGTCTLWADAVAPLTSKQERAIRARGYGLLRVIKREFETSELGHAAAPTPDASPSAEGT